MPAGAVGQPLSALGRACGRLLVAPSCGVVGTDAPRVQLEEGGEKTAPARGRRAEGGPERGRPRKELNAAGDG